MSTDVEIVKALEASPITMIMLDHPYYGVDVWDVESKIDYDTALSQGYIELRYIQNAVKFYNQWLNDLYKTGAG